jgi:hypothetical protein
MIFQARTARIGSGRTSPAMTPIEWVGVVMDFTVGTGIVLWHLLVATATTDAPGENRPVAIDDRNPSRRGADHARDHGA